MCFMVEKKIYAFIRIDTKNIRFSPKLYVFAPYRVELIKIPIHEHPIGYNKIRHSQFILLKTEKKVKKVLQL